jgi:hypothetical protein
MNKPLNTPVNSLRKNQSEDKILTLQYIVKQVEKGTDLSLSELKKQYSEDKIFTIALKHVTTTKKALCKALDLNVDNCCRFKRRLEKEGNLVQSIDEVICPFTKHPSHLISTNPKEFERLLKSNTNQLNLFK